jgi:cyclomaltodextrinase / maltogenic alpha-amylase / neopullulanase
LLDEEVGVVCSAPMPNLVHERANEIAGAVVYGVVPAFYDPPGFVGIAARLDDLADLGVSALWLSPITRSLPGDFGYAVTDYFHLRPEYGMKQDFRTLIQEAHARGLRVLMDFVPNHTSVAHPWFRDAAANGQTSPYWDFYDRDADGKPTHYFSWTHLPKLNYANPEVGRTMLDAFAYWVREFDVDGFRIDAIWGIRERNPEWLALFVREMRRLKPDMLLIAEASARDPFYGDQGFDAAYDWTDQLGHWAWEGVFGGSVPIDQAMTEALTDGGRGDRDDARYLRFLNNNDTGPRFLTTHGEGCYRTALAMLLTLPGMPCLFTGDEVGAAYHPYQQRGPLDWTDRLGLRAFTRRLIALRRGIPALHSRHWAPLEAEPGAPIFGYVRTDDEGRHPVVVLLNFSEDELEASVMLPAGLAESSTGELTDLWSDEPVSPATGNRLTVSIPAWGFRVLAAGPYPNPNGPHPNPSPCAQGEGLFSPLPSSPEWKAGG